MGIPKELADRPAPLAPSCGLCGEPIGVSCDGTEASHDGDGMEPCVNGHYACATNGRTGGPCAIGQAPDEEDPPA